MTINSLYRAMVVSLIAVSPNLVRAHPKQMSAGIAEDSNRSLGTIAWMVQEGPTGRILAQGRNTIRLKDISIRERSIGNEINGALRPRRSTPKIIHLNDQFTLEIAEFPTPNRAQKEGFGLAARRNDVKTFSWEWFDIKTDHRAAKLQESGELGIDVTHVGSGWEITRTEFLTDISLRVARMGVDPPGVTTWRVVILKGSVIRWPALADGRVILN